MRHPFELLELSQLGFLLLVAPLFLRDSFSPHAGKRSLLAHFKLTELGAMSVVLVFIDRYLSSHLKVGQSASQVGLVSRRHGVRDGFLSNLVSFQRLVPACRAVLLLFLLQEAAGDVVLLDIVRDVVDVLVSV